MTLAPAFLHLREEFRAWLKLDRRNDRDQNDKIEEDAVEIEEGTTSHPLD